MPATPTEVHAARAVTANTVIINIKIASLVLLVIINLIIATGLLYKACVRTTLAPVCIYIIRKEALLQEVLAIFTIILRKRLRFNLYFVNILTSQIVPTRGK